MHPRSGETEEEPKGKERRTGVDSYSPVTAVSSVRESNAETQDKWVRLLAQMDIFITADSIWRENNIRTKVMREQALFNFHRIDPAAPLTDEQWREISHNIPTGSAKSEKECGDIQPVVQAIIRSVHAMTDASTIIEFEPTMEDDEGVVRKPDAASYATTGDSIRAMTALVIAHVIKLSNKLADAID